MLRLFLLFTIVPLVELYLLIGIGRAIGVAPTIALVLFTGAVGAFFARMEGTRVLRRWREALAKNQVPKDGVIDGLLIFVGGLMLVTPGILTDAAGLAMVLPPTRRLIASRVRAWFDREVQRGTIHVVGGFPSRPMEPVPPGPVQEVHGEIVSAETIEPE